MFFFRVIERLRADAGREGERAAKTVIDAQSAPALLTLMIEIVPPLLLSCLPSEAASYKKEVKDAMLFIRFHFCKRLTLDEIAGAVGLNASYLCRVFKKETGENPFAYVNRLRMERAAALISGGEVYVKQVAASVGIDDPFYFTRMFKKHFGVAPSEYLKRNGA